MSKGQNIYSELKSLLSEMRLASPGGRRWATPGWIEKLQKIIDGGEWQVIESHSVPKDRDVLIYTEDHRVYQVEWSNLYNTWIMDVNDTIIIIHNATHWKEKPDSPPPTSPIRISREFLLGELTDLQAAAHSGADSTHLNERIDSLVVLAQQEFLDDKRSIKANKLG